MSIRQLATNVRQRLAARFRRGGDPNEARIRRRIALSTVLYQQLTPLKLLLFAVGYLWMLAIPFSYFDQRTYIDENALQPGQVNTYWNWGDVHRADTYLQTLESLRDTNATSEQRAKLLTEEFAKLGIPSAEQSYAFITSSGVSKGTNAYAVMSSPRASGTEAIVISASWLSRTGEGDGTLNLRGISTVLALARFLKQYSMWAKDIVFVVSDDYMDGMHAWLSAYHGHVQSNLKAEPLTLSSGVIWTALNIDYPGHSFSHLGIFFEGLNGRLPNQDLLNSFQHISRWTGGVPVLVYDHQDPLDHPWSTDTLPSWIPGFAREVPEVKAYAYRARNIARHVGYQARGRASGVHGLFHQYRIDAFTMFAVPADGPHGFHAIGRIIESTLRTANNLLERLHASYFFYIFTSPITFRKIGTYLPSAVLVSVAMMFGGLGEWVNAAWVDGGSSLDKKSEMRPETRWVRRRRPVLPALAVLLSTHILGIVVFFVVTSSWFIQHRLIYSPLLFIAVAILPLSALLIRPSSPNIVAPLSFLVKSLNLCFASTVISITSVLNFSLAASLAVLLGGPLSIATTSPGTAGSLARYFAYVALGFGWLLLGQDEMLGAVRNWEVLGVWFAPFVSIVYAPLVMQGGIVCLLQ
ncbi:hypothetical protein PLICRDRAFT_161388 [Plicaturopsis crispa FD-325 SS-3]|nr:hypothetical protein PLICRDRAFT_161388 [Plicaturopsis crispa FD-325 SS-3]